MRLIWHPDYGAFSKPWWPLAAIAGLVVLTLFTVGGHDSPLFSHDFLAFYVAGAEAAGGRAAELYDAESFQDSLVTYRPGTDVWGLYWMYPPPFLMALVPLGLLPLPVSFLICSVVSGALLFAIGRDAGGDQRFGWALLLLSMPAFYTIALGQMAAVFAALLYFGLKLTPTRPLLAGALFGLLTVKPHYGLLVPFFLLGGRHVMTILSATVSTVAIFTISLLIFGQDTWNSFLQNAGGDSRSFIFDNLFLGMPSIFQAVSIAGGSATVAFSIMSLFYIVLAYLILMSNSKGISPEAATLVGTGLVMPYLWFYDWNIVLLGTIVLLAQERARAPNRSPEPIFLVWLFPITPAFFRPEVLTTGVQITATALNVIQLSTLLYLVCRSLRRYDTSYSWSSSKVC